MTKKILVIDDHPETVRLIELTLRRHGYQVFGAGSGTEGLAMAESNPPDLFLLDIMMPDMDGLTVCRKIRENEKLRHLPVIMFTAKSQVADKKEGFEAGADDFLVKPTRPAELISRVEAMLAREGERVEGEEGAGSRTPERGKAFQVVVMLGARGGAGTTTVALNLAASMAGIGKPTTLVDLDTQQGHIAVYLGTEIFQGVNEWLHLPPDEMQYYLPDYLVEYDDMLELLLARPAALHPPGLPEPELVRAALDALLQRQRNLVFDLGRNRGEPVMPLLQRANHILICLRPERAAITATKQMVEQMSQFLPRRHAIHALMLDIGESDSLPRRSVEQYLGFPLFDTLTLYPQQIASAVNQDTPLVHLRRQSQLTQRFQEMAEQLISS